MLEQYDMGFRVTSLRLAGKKNSSRQNDLKKNKELNF